jgi:hypothetical protein
MSKKYIGFVYDGETVPFPSPGAPTHGHGKKYCILVKDGEVFYLNKDGSWANAGYSPLDIKRFVDRGDWAEFPQNPFET